MGGEKNLIPLNERTKEEQRKITTMGGKASGEARRKKRDLKNTMSILLDLPMKEGKMVDEEEANIMRAITPVEYVDSNLLDVDKNGNKIKPNAFGKKFVVYQGASDYNQAPKEINSVFHDIDFTKLSVESLETLNRCLSGIISPATMGLELARNSSDLSQREKEKVTLQTLNSLIEVEKGVLSKLFDITLRLYELMQDGESIPVKNDVSINFPEYANPTFESMSQTLTPMLSTGGISPSRYVEELWNDSLNDSEKEEEINYIENFLNRSTNPLDIYTDDEVV